MIAQRGGILVVLNVKVCRDNFPNETLWLTSAMT
jgi:hypothetical protein